MYCTLCSFPHLTCELNIDIIKLQLVEDNSHKRSHQRWLQVIDDEAIAAEATKPSEENQSLQSLNYYMMKMLQLNTAETQFKQGLRNRNSNCLNENQFQQGLNCLKILGKTNSNRG